MAVYLDESMFGVDSEINYPRLLLCTGVTCQMSDGMLIGCHVDAGGSEDENLAEMRRLVVAYENDHQLARSYNLYIIGNRQEGRLNGQKSAFDKALALGFHGTIWIYDTAHIADRRDGAFARLFSWGARPFSGSPSRSVQTRSCSPTITTAKPTT